jgi:uncharacterized Zn finger protein
MMKTYWCPACDEDVEVEELADVIGDMQVGVVEQCSKCGHVFEHD